MIIQFFYIFFLTTGSVLSYEGPTNYAVYVGLKSFLVGVIYIIGLYVLGRLVFIM